MSDAAHGVDAVYMLMSPGWEQELRANRWHFASRWARHVPVVLVQPTLSHEVPRSAAEPRIANCRVLHIARSSWAHSYARDVQRQVEQVQDDLQRSGAARPLLWFYYPPLAGLYALLPAACRVFHATENFFDFRFATEFFLAQTRFALGVSDVVVAVSGGVAASIRREVPRASPQVVTNGCDFAFYASGGEQAVAPARQPVAVYAGNINARIDFALLERCARAYPETLFALYGPVAGLGWCDYLRWRRLKARRNVQHFGPVHPDRLPEIYRGADLGLIPYRHDRWLVENGFPLKALEMGASGLPVVSSWMKPLDNLAAALVVCREPDAFVGAVGRVRRATLSAQERDELRAVSAANDYERKFAEVAALAAQAVHPVAKQDALPAALAGSGDARGVRHLLSAASGRVPPRVRSWMPQGALRSVKNWLERR